MVLQSGYGEGMSIVNASGFDAFILILAAAVILAVILTALDENKKNSQGFKW